MTVLTNEFLRKITTMNEIYSKITITRFSSCTHLLRNLATSLIIFLSIKSPNILPLLYLVIVISRDFSLLNPVQRGTTCELFIQLNLYQNGSLLSSWIKHSILVRLEHFFNISPSLFKFIFRLSSPEYLEIEKEILLLKD